MTRLTDILFAIALVAAIVSCFFSLSFGVVAVVVVVLSDLFCYALMNDCSKPSRALLGVVTALAWLLLIFA